MSRSLLSRFAPSLCTLLVLAGCGGGGGGGGLPGGSGLNLVRIAEAQQSGYILSNGSFAPVVRKSSDGWPLGVGDTGDRAALFSYVTFDISGIPGGAPIKTATLRCYQEGTGPFGNPYPTLGGRLALDHLDLQGVLDAADYTTPLMRAVDFATLAMVDTSGWYEVDVTARVQLDLDNGRTYSSFRIRFPVLSDNDLEDDITWWTGPVGLPFPGGNQPELVVDAN